MLRRVTRRLAAREERAWTGFHQMRTHLIAHLARELERESGLTEAEYAVLVTLAEAPDRRMRARDVGQALAWERSRLSHQLARMEERGSIRREPCASDGRGFDVVLTAAGLVSIRAAAPGHLELVRHCFLAVLTAEQLDALAEISEAITRHLETEHGASADTAAPSAEALYSD
jgi:DNA-binding MarR family transcriptional regulator